MSPKEGRVLVVLDVSEHCVETEARARHRAAMTEAFASPTLSEEQGAVLEALEAFIQQSDFRAMRANHPEIAGGTSGSVEIGRDQNGQIRWRFVHGTPE